MVNGRDGPEDFPELTPRMMAEMIDDAEKILRVDRYHDTPIGRMTEAEERQLRAQVNAERYRKRFRDGR